MSAAGHSQIRVAKAVGRSPKAIKRYLGTDEAIAEVRDERATLSQMYREKAEAILVSIDSETITKANLLQRATSSAICLDKALLLAGEPTQNVAVIVQVLDMLRMRDDEEIERQWQQSQGTP